MSINYLFFSRTECSHSPEPETWEPEERRSRAEKALCNFGRHQSASFSSGRRRGWVALRPGATMLLAVVPVTGLNLGNFVSLRVAGLGRYASAPAIFLEEERGGDVLPVPIPGDAVMAVEQALSPTYSAMLEVLLHSQPVSKRDDALFDNVPWVWNPSPQAKRDAFSRFSGRGYPREGYQSPYHLILDTLRRDGCADVSRVLIERTSMLGGLVVGGCVLLERRLPQAIDSGATRASGAGPAALEDGRWWVSDDEGGGGGGSDGSSEPVICECTTDEALGLAIALRCEVLVEAEVWQAAKTAPKYNTQRGKMRLEVWPRMPDDDDADADADGAAASDRDAPVVRLPWELRSASEVLEMTVEEKALSALAAGLRLPRARAATDEALIALLEPLLDETVRRELRVRRALEAGDLGAAAALEAGASRRGELLAEMRAAVEAERFGEAAELASQLRVETARRGDVTQDEGSYDRYLDQDDWCAQRLARELTPTPTLPLPLPLPLPLHQVRAGAGAGAGGAARYRPAEAGGA